MPQTRVKHSGTSDTHIVKLPVSRSRALAGTESDHLVLAVHFIQNVDKFLNQAEVAKTCHVKHKLLDEAIRLLHLAYDNITWVELHNPVFESYRKVHQRAQRLHAQFDRECVR